MITAQRAGQFAAGALGIRGRLERSITPSLLALNYRIRACILKRQTREGGWGGASLNCAQGDPGSTVFFVSMQDQIVTNYTSFDEQVRANFHDAALGVSRFDPHGRIALRHSVYTRTIRHDSVDTASRLLKNDYKGRAPMCTHTCPDELLGV